MINPTVHVCCQGKEKYGNIERMKDLNILKRFVFHFIIYHFSFIL